MNIMKDNIDQRRKDVTDKPMVVKPTKIGNTLMPPPSNTVKGFVTPSSNRNRPNIIGSSTSSRSISSSTNHHNSHVIAAICEGRGRATGIVGIAAVDVHHPILILSQISDSQNYVSTLTKLNILGPVEIIVPATFVEGATTSRIISVIVNQFPNLTVNSVPRSEFNRVRGLQMIQHICASGFNAVILQIEQKFYTSAASCALLRYIEQSRRVIYSPKTLKIEYQEPEFTTAIDIDTAILLDLTSSSGKQNVSLFSVLNYCSTKPGKKLLRTNILQPPCRKDILQTRLDCIQELLENPNLLIRLQETLKPLCDIESALTFATILPSEAASVSERQLNYTLQLKGLLIAVQPLADEMKAMKHPVFRYIYNRIEGLDTRKKILDLINEIINEDAHLAKGQAGELQRCFAIKSGINGFLDLSRRLYTEGVDSMRAYVENLADTYNLPLRVQHTIKSGFHIILPLTKALRNLKKTDLPEVFTKVERYSTHFYLTTMDMINYDKRLKNNSTEIQNIGNVLIYQLLANIRPFIGDLYNLCEDVAQLDMLVSLTKVSSLPNWVRPKIVDTHMNLEGARHPILEHIGDQDPVSNSVFAYPRLPLHIITGPNMSGKTILLHSICLIQILFQLGCYVPCTEATLRVAQRVYARVADDDELTLQASSFTLEMAKIAYLMTTVNDKSLVVLDEICRTTGCDEGAMLAFALCESLMKVGCFIFVGTHFQVLTLMEDLYPTVANWHLETIEENRDNNKRISLKFTYKLLPGVTSIQRYGIKLSQIFNSSRSISDRAEILHDFLLPLRKSFVSKSAKHTPDYLKHKLQSELDLLKIKNQLTNEIQQDKIAKFQTETGIHFEPSPLLSFDRSSSIANQSSSKNKTSSKSTSKQKISSDSNSWIPPSVKSNNFSSNHEFSVPSSSKSKENNKKEINNHIFSCDEEDLQKRIPENISHNPNFDSFEKLKSFDSENISFSPHDGKLSSIHENSSSRTNKNRKNSYNTQENINDKLSSIHRNHSFLYTAQKNIESQNDNFTFSEANDPSLTRRIPNFYENAYSGSTNWSSAQNTIDNRTLKSVNCIVDSSVRDSVENSIPNSSIIPKNVFEDFSQEMCSPYTDESITMYKTLSAGTNKNHNYICNFQKDFNFQNDDLKVAKTNFGLAGNISDSFQNSKYESINWSSAGNTINNMTIRSTNCIVNSTPDNSIEKSIPNSSIVSRNAPIDSSWKVCNNDYRKQKNYTENIYVQDSYISEQYPKDNFNKNTSRIQNKVQETGNPLENIVPYNLTNTKNRSINATPELCDKDYEEDSNNSQKYSKYKFCKNIPQIPKEIENKSMENYHSPNILREYCEDSFNKNTGEIQKEVEISKENILTEYSNTLGINSQRKSNKNTPQISEEMQEKSTENTPRQYRSILAGYSKDSSEKHTQRTPEEKEKVNSLQFTVSEIGHPYPDKSLAKTTPQIKIQRYSERSTSCNIQSDNISSISSKSLAFSSILDVSSPILTKKRRLDSEKIISNASQIRLVSNLYDSDSEQENNEDDERDNSPLNEDAASDSSIVLIEDDVDEKNGSHPEICSLDELNFSSYLNMRKSITSTPIPTRETSEITAETAFVTADSNISPPNTFPFDSAQSQQLPNQKGEFNCFNQFTRDKVQKKSKNTSDSTSYGSCVSSKFSNFSTEVRIGQNIKKPAFRDLNEHNTD